jgi:hypothetical protein
MPTDTNAYRPKIKIGFLLSRGYNPKFFISLFASLAMAVSITAVGVYFRSENQIKVGPTYNATFVAPPNDIGFHRLAPISAIGEIATSRNSNRTVLIGYFAKISDLCSHLEETGDTSEKNEGASYVLFVRAVNTEMYKASPVRVTTNVCALITTAGRDSPILAASDTPFVDVKSDRDYVIVDHAAK